MRASQLRKAYVTGPDSQHALDQVRHTAATLRHRYEQAATDALRTGVLLHEYWDQPTYYFHHLHRQQATVTPPPKKAAGYSHHSPAAATGSPMADLCTVNGRQQADSNIVLFISQVTAHKHVKTAAY